MDQARDAGGYPREGPLGLGLLGVVVRHPLCQMPAGTGQLTTMEGENPQCCTGLRQQGRMVHPLGQVEALRPGIGGAHLMRRAGVSRSYFGDRCRRRHSR